MGVCAKSVAFEGSFEYVCIHRVVLIFIKVALEVFLNHNDLIPAHLD